MLLTSKHSQLGFLYDTFACPTLPLDRNVTNPLHAEHPRLFHNLVPQLFHTLSLPQNTYLRRKCPATSVSSETWQYIVVRHILSLENTPMLFLQVPDRLAVQ
jgi:hypothetical protein